MWLKFLSVQHAFSAKLLRFLCTQYATREKLELRMLARINLVQHSLRNWHIASEQDGSRAVVAAAAAYIIKLSSDRRDEVTARDQFHATPASLGYLRR